MLVFQLAIILIASKIAGDISVRLGQPSVLGKLLIGIVLGPSILGIISNTEILQELSQIGVILLMFIAGLETDTKEFKRTGKASAYVGVAGIIAPFGLGYLAGVMIGLPPIESVLLGLLLSATSVSISVQFSVWDAEFTVVALALTQASRKHLSIYYLGPYYPVKPDDRFDGDLVKYSPKIKGGVRFPVCPICRQPQYLVLRRLSLAA